MVYFLPNLFGSHREDKAPKKAPRKWRARERSLVSVGRDFPCLFEYSPPCRTATMLPLRSANSPGEPINPKDFWKAGLARTPPIRPARERKKDIESEDWFEKWQSSSKRDLEDGRRRDCRKREREKENKRRQRSETLPLSRRRITVISQPLSDGRFSFWFFTHCPNQRLVHRMKQPRPWDKHFYGDWSRGWQSWNRICSCLHLTCSLECST